MSKNSDLQTVETLLIGCEHTHVLCTTDAPCLCTACYCHSWSVSQVKETLTLTGLASLTWQPSLSPFPLLPAPPPLLPPSLPLPFPLLSFFPPSPSFLPLPSFPSPLLLSSLSLPFPPLSFFPPSPSLSPPIPSFPLPSSPPLSGVCAPEGSHSWSHGSGHLCQDVTYWPGWLGTSHGDHQSRHEV